MNETIIEIDSLVSELGRFLIEMQNTKEDIFLMIEAASVSPEIKSVYSGVVKTLVEDLEKEIPKGNATSTVTFSRYSIIKLLDAIDKKDTEQYHLFETTRNAILRAENSALGWPSDYLTQ